MLDIEKLRYALALVREAGGTHQQISVHVTQEDFDSVRDRANHVGQLENTASTGDVAYFDADQWFGITVFGPRRPRVEEAA